MKEHQFGTLNISNAMIISFLLISSCVGPYHVINPQEYELTYEHHKSQEREMKIAWQVDILKSTRNKKYVRMERKNDVHLLLVKFKNLGDNDVNIPGDCIFMLVDSTELIPLTLGEAMDAFIGYYPSEVEAKQAANNIILKIGAFISNEARIVKSHVDFSLELHAYYIESRVLGPGEELTGLLAIPLFKDETFHIKLVDDHY
jgi:hypothetical protein